MPAHLLRPTNLKVGFIGIVALLLLPACSVNVKKDKNGEEKNVDIRTPIGNIDTGLAIYPGARLKREENDHDRKSANVNLSFGDYGLKVIALEYESDDASEKLIAFYQSQLKKYGDVIECHVHGKGGHVQAEFKHDSNSQSLSCEDSGGSTIELKVGTKENQRIVAVEPHDKGCNFALVRVQTHGKDTI